MGESRHDHQQHAGSSIAAIGKPMQIAFVPDDFDAALAHWTQAMGVGPFFVMENIVLEDMALHGRAIGLQVYDRAGAMGRCADRADPARTTMRRRSIAATICPQAARCTMCACSPTISRAARAAVEAGGGLVLVEGKVGADGAVIYADCGPAATRPNAGAIVEVLQPASGSEGFFAMIADAAKGLGRQRSGAGGGVA